MKYAIFILTHKRPDRQITLETLMKCGYTGDWYLICGDEDETLDRYKELYGDKVVTFNKMEYLPKVDLLTNKVSMVSTIYVRNAVYDVAKSMGYDYFGQFDDDIGSFVWRYEKDGRLLSKNITDITKYFDALIEYMDDAGLAATGVASSGSMVGGVETLRKGPKFNICQSFFCSNKKRMWFDGILATDLNAIVRASKEGKVIIEPLFVGHTSPDRGSKEGGLTKQYNSSNEYTWNFFPVVYSPSNVSIYIKNGAYRTKRATSKMIPKILNERYKK